MRVAHDNGSAPIFDVALTDSRRLYFSHNKLNVLKNLLRRMFILLRISIFILGNYGSAAIGNRYNLL